ncbi:hypothetical protein KQX54_009935 [Cotesia glomerata]|uniref:Uncharacterized protein n=1 Tax=Cotesia glomerata TaxID=32391 RepID=A0AAV7IW15_COTGL|nr:hypothetical protein KQX54_009935 [Cotesia glomerata]
MARRERFLTREVVDRSKELVKYHQHRTGIPTSAAPIFWDSWIEKVYANPDLETANETFNILTASLTTLTVRLHLT